MKIKFYFLISVLFFPLLTLTQTLSTSQLKCEYKTNPLPLDETTPRLSYEIISDKNNTLQVAHHIKVATSKESLAQGKLIWDSGKTNSDQSIHIPYAGSDLQSRQRYFWQIKVWDNHNRESKWSEVAFWEMGLLNKEDWQAQWIEPQVEENPKKSNPVPMLRRSFSINKPIAWARLYITSHGLYEAWINNQRVGDQLFTPGWTSLNKRLQYQAYDVSHLIKEGDNATGVLLGDGWYRGYIGFRGQRNFYGDQLALLYQLEINYKDGSKEVINSDDSWKSNTGVIRFSDIYNGGLHDTRLERKGWTRSAYNDKKWSGVNVKKFGYDQLIAPDGPPVKAIEEIKPVDIITTPEGDTVIDFGQNMVGWIRLEAEGKSGDTITIRHAEVLDKEGNFYTDNLRYAQQTMRYVTDGKGKQTFEPKFTFQGFRYAAVSGYPGNLSTDDLVAVVIHSEMEKVGQFECSEPLINQLQHNIQWGQKGNFLDVPTDCPQRDERLGWTGDAQAFCRTAAYNFQVGAFFTKWMQDFIVDQTDKGGIPWVIPHVLGQKSKNATGWADAVTIIPWDLYQTYGDQRMLERQYESMCKWIEYMEREAGADYLWNTGFHFGDWLFYSINDDRHGKSAVTDKYLIAQSFFANSIDIVRKSASILGKDADRKKYDLLYENVVNAFREEYITPNGRLVSSTQTAYTLALLFNLFPEEQRRQAAERLVRNIHRYNDHLTTGFLGTPHLCHVLSDQGYTDLAYILLQQETYPSWLYPVTMGATTIWERWDGIKPDSTFQNVGMNSFNHYAYGAIGDWLYRVVAGIDTDASQPGYKQSFIRPQPGGTLTSAAASHKTMYGAITSNWRVHQGQFNLRTTVPVNTTTTIILPATTINQVKQNGVALKKGNGILSISEKDNTVVVKAGSGRYAFEYPADNLPIKYRTFSTADTIEDLLVNEKTRVLIQQHLPDLINYPYLEKVKDKSIDEAIKSFIIQVDNKVIKTLNEALKKIRK